MEMKSRFEKLNMLLPVLLADALLLLFSDNEWERKFMVKFWELLKIYSKRKLDNNIPNYPRGEFRHGPVPIWISWEELEETENLTFQGRQHERDF
jgi:hypothetical protein